MTSQRLVHLGCIRCAKRLLQSVRADSKFLGYIYHPAGAGSTSRFICSKAVKQELVRREWHSSNCLLTDCMKPVSDSHQQIRNLSTKCDIQLLRRQIQIKFCDETTKARLKHTGKGTDFYTEKERLERFEKFVKDYEKKTANNLFKDGITTRQAVAIGAGLGLIYYVFLRDNSGEEPKIASNTTVSLYRKMPLKSMSRVWGKMTSWELPETLRGPMLGLYCLMFGVQLHEAEEENLKNYKSLNELFRRSLKPGMRVIDSKAPMTSPADGKVLHFGKVENGIVEQVKGVNYSIQGFLGPQAGDEERTKLLRDEEYQQKMNIKPGNELFNCIIYLAPGDYHRFHSSCDWKIAHRRHFPGELLSVNPGIARWVQGLFNLNERAVYSGSWKHGYFSYTAVGATNVGSIKIYFDKNLETNIGPPYPGHVYHDKSFGEPGSQENISVTKGEMLGEFNLGSTVVLLFEAPKDFQFSVHPGQKVRVGESLGDFSD